MKSMILNEREFELLEGEPHLYFRLYLLLRWAMDRKTKRVGSASAISWGWMARELEVQPKRGRHSNECGRLSAKALRNACEGLETLGLLQPCGNGETVVFLLPKASVALSRPKDEGQVRGRVEGHGQTHAGAAFAGDEGQGANGYEGRQLRYQVNPISVVNKKAAPCAQPVDNFQPDTMLVVAAGFASWLRKAEHARGCIAKVKDDEPAVLSWATDSITIDQLRDAYEAAAWDRERTNNPHPINAPFLNTILRRRLGGSMVSRKADSASPKAWHSHAEGIAAKAQELGLARHPDEDDQAFKSRVVFEDGKRADAEREAKKRGR